MTAGHPEVRCRTDNGWKRGFDIVAALSALVILSPLLLLIAAIVKLTDGGSVFYGHSRVGRRGGMFRCWKFRTMVENGDEVLQAHLQSDPAAALEWEATRKLQSDPRVTRIGAVLRKLSLDELPQLFNILVGDMSVVGPRPVTTDELRYYGVHLGCYLRARPGLTGLWQISGRNDVSYDERVSFDRRYVENWTFVGDVAIIVRTVPAVCLSRGSY
ncbi:sugar transferase [Aureimonas populi]|uniref:Sugar transferase n=1 Tax=Aureimonas populi TaxID=1701758 RepID=A0ABW5CQZ5_9HYPH|nr:sugar transferase [Aureimonas populi]